MSKFREVLFKRFAIVCFGNNKYFRCVTPVVAFACINATVLVGCLRTSAHCPTLSVEGNAYFSLLWKLEPPTQ